MWRCLGNKCPMYLSLVDFMIYHFWDLTVQFIFLSVITCYICPRIFQVGTFTPAAVGLTSLPTALPTMSASQWMNHITYPTGFSSTFICSHSPPIVCSAPVVVIVASTNKNTNHGYPIHHLAPAYMPIPPPFFREVLQYLNLLSFFLKFSVSL